MWTGSSPEVAFSFRVQNVVQHLSDGLLCVCVCVCRAKLRYRRANYDIFKLALTVLPPSYHANSFQSHKGKYTKLGLISEYTQRCYSSLNLTCK